MRTNISVAVVSPSGNNAATTASPTTIVRAKPAATTPAIKPTLPAAPATTASVTPPVKPVAAAPSPAATPVTAYYDNRYVDEVKRSGFFEQLWR